MAKLGLLAGALAEQAGVRVSGGEMRVILALLPMEVALRIATASRRRRRPATVLRYKALHAGPRFDQRPIDREMLAGEQFSHLRQMEHAGKELGGDIPVEQPVPVLAKYRRIPDRLPRRKPAATPGQQGVVELLPPITPRSNRSGGIDGRPSHAYSRSKARDNDCSAASTSSLIWRSG